MKVTITLPSTKINKKKKYFTANILSHIQKPVSNFHLCQFLTINMPTEQFFDVPNKSFISNNCCVYDIMVI